MRGFGTINALKYTFAKYKHILIHFVLQTNVVRIYSQVSLVKKLSFSFMLPLSTFVAPISTIAPNETNSCHCSKVPFKDYFMIKQQPENGDLPKYQRVYSSNGLNRGILQW